MKIATKYEVDSVCKAIKNHLESEWPQTLDELIRLQKDVLVAKSECISPNPDFYKIFPEPASAIRLATDFDVPSILPTAYYILSTLDADVNWDADKPVPHRDASTRGRPARFSLLRDSEMLRYYQGKYRLSKEHAAMDDSFRSDITMWFLGD